MAVTTVRDDALTTSTDLAQAGAVFNDSTRLVGHGTQGGGPIASGRGNSGGQGGHGNSGEHGNHGGQPVPSFWNSAETSIARTVATIISN